jgi:hypothetical protein
MVYAVTNNTFGVYLYSINIILLVNTIFIRPFEKRDVLWERPWRAGGWAGGRRPILSGAYLLHVWRDFNETS